MARESLAQYLADLQVEISSRETNLVYGIVESKEPVKINYNGITLEGEFLLVDKSANIKLGERVPLLKTNRSQKFILLRFGEDELDWDELVSIPETATRWPSWSEITSKPSLFSTEWDLVSNKPTLFNSRWDLVGNKPTLFNSRWDLVSDKPTTFKPESHTHPWAEVTGKPTTFPPSTHTHTWSSITDKPTTFTPSTHTHGWNTITGKPAYTERWPTWSEVTSKPSTFTPSSHTHPIDSVTNVNASGNGLAIGKASEKDAFEVAWPAEFKKGIAFLDTRGVSPTPESLPSRAVSFEFKSNSVVGNPPVTASSGYSHIINVAGWNVSEGSGGWPTQISVSGSGIAVRQATSATTWSPWRSVVATIDPMIESGSNTNGRYIRFSDGTMICRHSITWNGVLTNATASGMWTFPAVFSNEEIPALSITAQNSSTTPANASILTAGEYSTIGNSSAVRGIAVKNTSSATRDITVHLIAVGRWK